MKRRGKYNARRTTIDGVTFASAREASRFVALRMLERGGYIADLELQPAFDLHAPGGRKVGRYVADFRYLDVRTGLVVVEDSKGFRTPIYRWKIKHLRFEYGIEVVEV